eukprot:gene9350-biopygen10723
MPRCTWCTYRETGDSALHWSTLRRGNSYLNRASKSVKGYTIPDGAHGDQRRGVGGRGARAANLHTGGSPMTVCNGRPARQQFSIWSCVARNHAPQGSQDMPAPRPRHARATPAPPKPKKWPIARATPAPLSCDPRNIYASEKQKGGTEADASRTHPQPFLSQRELLWDHGINGVAVDRDDKAFHYTAGSNGTCTGMNSTASGNAIFPHHIIAPAMVWCCSSTRV